MTRTYDIGRNDIHSKGHFFDAPGHRRRGLTLFETSLATLIVGLSVLAITRLVTAVHQQNFYAQKTTTALTLANSMRELLAGMPFTDPANGVHLGPLSWESGVTQYTNVEDFNGLSANPPIDANRQAISSLPNWRQQVTVTHVNPNNYSLTDSLATDQACVLDRVTVTVSYNATPGNANTWMTIATMEWLKSKY